MAVRSPQDPNTVGTVADQHDDLLRSYRTALQQICTLLIQSDWRVLKNDSKLLDQITTDVQHMLTNLVLPPQPWNDADLDIAIVVVSLRHALRALQMAEEHANATSAALSGQFYDEIRLALRYLGIASSQLSPENGVDN